MLGLPGGFPWYAALLFCNFKDMSNDWQGRSPERVRRNELVAYWSVIGLIVTGLLVALWNPPPGHLVRQVHRLRVDSVDYRGIGHDNTLQLDPYWKVWTSNPRLVVRSGHAVEVGDSITVIIENWRYEKE